LQQNLASHYKNRAKALFFMLCNNYHVCHITSNCIIAQHKNIKENMFIILNVYCIGVLVGLIIEITNFII
jgi:hypothetical protein